MPIKRPVKTVEIADDSVLDLKSRGKERAAASETEKEDLPFRIHHIDAVPSSTAVTTDAVMERPVRSPRFDQDTLNERMESFAEKLEKAVIKVSPQEGSSMPNVAASPKDLIRVKFEKFVQLVATKDFLSVLEQNKNEDIILSSNLLTELASAVEEKQEKKSPVIFLVGLAIGVIVTYLLINK